MISPSQVVACSESADETLIRGVADGDEDALGALYDRHASVLLSIALRILRDPAEATDVVHDAFVTVADRAGQYIEARGSVRAWLRTLARNLRIDRLRAGSRKDRGSRWV